MSLFDLLFPKKCLDCSKIGRYICPTCLKKLNRPKPICPLCQKPSIDGFTHIRCKTSYSLDGLFSVFRYRGVIKKAIKILKFKFADDVVKEIVKVSLYVLKKSTFPFSKKYILVPIPLHKSRENWRGFNQSELLGKEIAKDLGFIYVGDVITKTRSTEAQSMLTKKERSRNITAAFTLNKKYKLAIKGKDFIVFDDIYTTGSTLKEVSKVLKRNGAGNVWGLTIAR